MSYIERIARQHPDTVLEPAELAYYARHLLLPGIGVAGQKMLKNARVLVVGAGGLGCPALQALAGAGVGSISIIDGDSVSRSNLSRQWLHSMKTVGQNKALSAKAALADLNPFIEIEAFPEMLDASNAVERIAASDLVIDATDDLAARYCMDDVCADLDRPWIHGALYRETAQMTVFWGRYGARFRDLFPEPSDGPSCSGAGMLGASASMIANLQAMEAIKLITGQGIPEIGTLCTLQTTNLRLERFQIANVALQRFEAPGAASDGCARAIDPVELKQWISIHQLPTILDLRSEHPDGLPGAIACSDASLLEDGIPPSETEIILLVCEEGTLSELLAQAFSQSETRVAYLEGGMTAWRALPD